MYILGTSEYFELYILMKFEDWGGVAYFQKKYFLT